MDNNLQSLSDTTHDLFAFYLSAATVVMHQRVIYSTEHISKKVCQSTVPTWSDRRLMLYILYSLVWLVRIILKYYADRLCLHVSVQTISINIGTLIPQNILPLKCWRDFSCHFPQWVMYWIIFMFLHSFVHICSFLSIWLFGPVQSDAPSAFVFLMLFFLCLRIIAISL